ncbi:hypothetical protein IG193_00955 [Infirmifilum lucidum]|uniref:Uncharacterized protein n=1 Tax=Infirmifilum lucidum TaxID=2776706 RepID=A0A7L9FH76_9CREN|nr:hypothetical protein [Infirmifilum lucidum]QOJ79067.1 hypothetical protein IG193_00955 [Infirmifilum lucidum]
MSPYWREILLIVLIVLALAAVVMLVAGPPILIPASGYWDALQRASEMAARIEGHVNLTVKILGEYKYEDRYVLLPADTPLGVTPSEGYRLSYAVRDKHTGTIYAVYIGAGLNQTKLAIIRGSTWKLVDLKFRKVEEKLLNGTVRSLKLPTERGVEEMIGFSRCRVVTYKGYVEEPLTQEVQPLEAARAYVDCTYTTRLGVFDLATTHARAWIEYIPNNVITAIYDYSYEEHNPLVYKCSFNSWNYGVGTRAATVRAEGKFMICYLPIIPPNIVYPSTQWTQFSQFLFDVSGQVLNCDGHHSASYSLFCSC